MIDFGDNWKKCTARADKPNGAEAGFRESPPNGTCKLYGWKMITIYRSCFFEKRWNLRCPKDSQCPKDPCIVYLPTFTKKKSTIHVCRYTSQMDPMGWGFMIVGCSASFWLCKVPKSDTLRTGESYFLSFIFLGCWWTSTWFLAFLEASHVSWRIAGRGKLNSTSKLFIADLRHFIYWKNHTVVKSGLSLTMAPCYQNYPPMARSCFSTSIARSPPSQPKKAQGIFGHVWWASIKI